MAQALDGSNILRFAFETAALNIPTKYNVLQDVAVEQIGGKLESSGQGTDGAARQHGQGHPPIDGKAHGALLEHLR